MWVQFDEKAIEKDMKTLSSYGINVIRAFPIWRDFQPAEPFLYNVGKVREYRLHGNLPQNPYYLDSEMLRRFGVFCDICEKYGMKIIVGLITGWMSGRLFVPVALNEKNLYTDETARWLEQLYIKGFVREFKKRDIIMAWDLGNECCEISHSENRYVTADWTAMISNAIKAEDSTRPVVSGMRRLEIDTCGDWRIKDHALYVDIMTTHPYPFWFDLTEKSKLSEIKAQLHATAGTKYFADLSGLPCFVEEVGNMGNSVCDDETAANYLRTQLFSVWANGGGVMWWCANEQSMLDFPPYTWQMCEVELGLTDADGKPKETLREYKKFAEWREKCEIDLPKAKIDGVCILTKDQRQYASALSCYVLAKQVGMNLSFAWCEDELPDSDTYLLPSVCGIVVMDALRYKALKNKVKDGATLYISNNGAILSDFEGLTGLRIKDSDKKKQASKITLNGKNIPFVYGERRNFFVEAGADAVAKNTDGNIVMSEHKYGKGRVIYLDYPVENNLAYDADSFEGDACEIYRYIFREKIEKSKFMFANKGVSTTYHESEDGRKYAVSVNYSDKEYDFEYRTNGVNIKKILYSDDSQNKKILPFGVIVSELE